MIDGLGLRPGTLALSPHDPRWMHAFALAEAEIAKLPSQLRLYHIGSTAVPGLAAKPILDLGATAPMHAHNGIVSLLARSGWIDRGARSGRLLIRILRGKRTHNLHFYRPNDPDLAAQIAFRDQLRADPNLRAAYAAEKRRIIRAGTPRKAYAGAKSEFIRHALPR